MVGSILRCLAVAIAMFVTKTGPVRAASGTHVYIMRGLLDVSTGLDDLAVKLRRRGIDAAISSYSSEANFTASAIQHARARGGCGVIIVGHSLGADAAIGMARKLHTASVPVALIVTFSPASSDTVPPNVAHVLNFYQSNSYWNNTYASGPGFKGSIRNVDLARYGSVDHLNIEKLNRLHARAIQSIEANIHHCSAPHGKATISPVVSKKG